MVEVYRSGVNTWDCDEMGHMNVRFYVARSVDGLFGLAQLVGFGPRYMRERKRTLVVRDQHIRFHREMRPGTPYFINAGIIEADESCIKVYEEMVNAMTGLVSATFVADVQLTSTDTRERIPYSAGMINRLQTYFVELPDYASPRGTSRDDPRTPPTLQEAENLGLIPIYRGVVLSADADEQGFMQVYSYMGRISDGITHFFMAIRDEDGPRDKGTGGAALEYRFVYHQTPQVGDILVIRSGLKGIIGKASNFCHWMFSAETGECVATTEAVAISFDLTTRKAIELSPPAREKMMAKAVPSLSV